jgi:uncharacterized lipoprotein YajG
MDHRKWLLGLTALIAVGLMAGCGSSSSSSTTTTSSTAASGSSSTTTTSVASTGATPDDVYQACLNAIKGTAAETAGQSACAQARDGFQQCITQASNAPEGTARDTALKACQQAADQATAALNSSP